MHFSFFFAVIIGFASGFNGYLNASTAVATIDEEFGMCPAPEFERPEAGFDEYEQEIFEIFYVIEIEFLPIDEAVEREAVEEAVVSELAPEAAQPAKDSQDAVEVDPGCLRIIGFVSQLLILFVAISILAVDIDEIVADSDSSVAAPAAVPTPVVKLYVAEEVKPMSLTCKPRNVKYVGHKKDEEKKPCTSDC